MPASGVNSHADTSSSSLQEESANGKNINKIRATLRFSYEVEQHRSPVWLGRQHLDIYFPKLNIGIEYQVRQHSDPIDFFGGQAAFEKTLERDKRKRMLCETNDCFLIYVFPNYEIDSVIKKIESFINLRLSYTK